MTLQELFTDESKWTKNASARDINGKKTEPQSKTAICWCLHGGIRATYDYYLDSEDIMIKVQEYVMTNYPYPSFTLWNDAPERTFEDIKKLITELNI